MIRCRFCGKTNPKEAIRCDRCGKRVDIDPSSIQRSLAFLITAVILYIPANLFPILKTSTMLNSEASTIISGIIDLFAKGDYPIALIILTASVLIPILKFLALAYIIYTIRKCDKKSVVEISTIHKITEMTGPWSMVDLFVVIILSALIHFNMIKIVPGPAAAAFGLMVLFTLFSSMSVDIRILGEDCAKRRYS